MFAASPLRRRCRRVRCALVATLILLCLLLTLDLVTAEDVIRISLVAPMRDEALVHENHAAADALRYAVRDAQAAGYLAGARVDVVVTDTTPVSGTKSGGGTAIFGALEALQNNASAIVTSTSEDSKQVSLVTAPLHVPVCSYLASAAELSDKRLYPHFFRYMTSSETLEHALFRWCRAYGWARVGIVFDGTDWFMGGLGAAIQAHAADEGVALTAAVNVQGEDPSPSTLAVAYNALVAGDTYILCLAQSPRGAARTLASLWSRGWFNSTQPRVVFTYFSPLDELRAADPAAYTGILGSSTTLLPSTWVFDEVTIWYRFLTEFFGRTGQRYPHDAAFLFANAYACGVSLAVGLHRLAERAGSTAAVAHRVPAVFEKYVAFDLFNITPAGAPGIAYPLPWLDAHGDVVPSVFTLFALNTSVPANFSGVPATDPPAWYFWLCGGIFANGTTDRRDCAFPGGTIPLDATRKELTNLVWSSLRGRLVESFACLAAIVTLASLAATVALRRHPPYTRASLTTLVVLHVQALAAIGAAVLFGDPPSAVMCNVRLVFLTCVPCGLIAAAAPRIVMIHRVYRYYLATVVKPAAAAAAAGGGGGRGGRIKRSRFLTNGSAGSGASSSGGGGTVPRARTLSSMSAVLAGGGGALRKSMGNLARGISSHSLNLLGRTAAPDVTPVTVPLTNSEETTPSATASRESKRDAPAATVSRTVVAYAQMLDGSRPQSMSLATLATLAGLAVPYTAAGAYYVLACDASVVRITRSVSSYSLVCQCRSPNDAYAATLTGVFAFHALALVFLGVRAAQAWDARFNLNETRRWTFALANATLAGVLATVVILADAVSRFTGFFICLIVYAALTSVVGVAGPLHTRWYRQRARARRGSVGRVADEDGDGELVNRIAGLRVRADLAAVARARAASGRVKLNEPAPPPPAPPVIAIPAAKPAAAPPPPPATAEPDPEPVATVARHVTLALPPTNPRAAGTGTAPRGSIFYASPMHRRRSALSGPSSNPAAATPPLSLMTLLRRSSAMPPPASTAALPLQSAAATASAASWEEVAEVDYLTARYPVRLVCTSLFSQEEEEEDGALWCLLEEDPTASARQGYLVVLRGGACDAQWALSGPLRSFEVSNAGDCVVVVRGRWSRRSATAVFATPEAAAEFARLFPAASEGGSGRGALMSFI
ncbi:hypothetical protein H9P43_008760 [Blastocladiella emersonii ATCC 22665]|nr:hypothetical protein H9P43_008760 [Blastocladiella emersonii ATCC 22665]